MFRGFFTTVREKGRTLLYASLFGGVVAAAGGIMYTLFAELNDTNGSYSIVQRAISQIEQDSQLMSQFGPTSNLKVYGQSNRYGRRRPHVISRVLDDGSRCYDTSFWLEGSGNPQNPARVTYQVVEDGDGQLVERFLAVDLPGQEKRILIQPIHHRPSTFSRVSSYLFGTRPK